MLAEQRQHRILELLQEAGVVHTTHLAEALHVSSETIRKDLDTLAAEGRVNKVHGGALLPETPAGEGAQYEPYAARSQKNADSKQRIAEAAAALVSEGESIALDDGTSGYAMANVLCSRFHRLTVVTNSLKSAAAMVDNRNFTVILCGGVVAADDYACVGDFATLILEKLTVDVLFLTASGITENALTDQRLEEIRIQQQMVACARKVVVLADSTKFGKDSFVRLCEPENVDVIITDKAPEPALANALREKGCRIVVAKEN